MERKIHLAFSQLSTKDDETLEFEIQKRLERILGYGHMNVPSGIIDILTDTHIIEIKNWNAFDKGIGQLFRYAVHYPNHQKRLHCFGTFPSREKYIIYRNICESTNILLTYENEQEYISDWIQSHTHYMFDHITRIWDEIERVNSWLKNIGIQSLDYNALELKTSSSTFWDCIIKYNGYPISFEVEDERSAKETLSSIDHLIHNKMGYIKVLGQTSLYIRIILDYHCIEDECYKLKSELFSILANEVAIGVVIVRDEWEQRLFKQQLKENVVEVFHIKELISDY